MKIRPAKASDAEAIADLWNAMIRDTLATFTTEEKTHQAVQEMIAARAGAFWVAEADAVLAFVTYGPFRSGPGYAATVEHTIILAPAARGHGLGRQLMQTALNAAGDAGHHVMVAGISSANPDAIAFHAALGFVQTAQMPQVGRKAGQWLDLVFMQKMLSPR